MPDTRAIHSEIVRTAARAELERRKRMMERKKEAEDDLVAFIRMFWRVLEPSTPLVEGWVLDAIADFLMAATDGHIKRGIINVPPGSGKSLILNCFWPAWEWGPCNMPHLRVISASYNEGLPERDNGRFLRLIQDPTYQRLWGDRVKVTKESVSWVENAKTGWKITTSTHSGTTGHRGDRIAIDDANDPNNVESDPVREKTIHWLREVMPDRLNNQDEGVVICLQQRTHDQDATGVLAKYGRGYVEHWLCIPMEMDPLRIFPVVLRRGEDGQPTDIWTDPRTLDEAGNQLDGLYTDKDGKPKVRMGSPMAKAEGMLAWPQRFSPDAVQELKTIKGPYAYAGQYQQMPSPRGGGIIREDWWLPWLSPTFPDMGTVVLFLDTALEEGKENDYNAATIWGAFEGKEGEPNLMLMGAWRDRLPLAQLVTRVAELCEKFKVDYLLVEHKTRGRDVHDEIRRNYQAARWSTVLVPVERDKASRLHAVSVLFSGDVKKMPVPGDPSRFMDVWAGGMIYAPNTDWASEVISEVSNFPRGAHDDWVDTVSGALEWVRKNGVVLRKVEYDEKKLEEMKFRKPMRVPYTI